MSYDTITLKPGEAELVMDVPGLRVGSNYASGRIDALAAAQRLLNQEVPKPPKYGPQTLAQMPEGFLRQYQLDGVQMLSQKLKNFGGAILADEMGLGKTRVTITLAASLNHYPVVVIARASVRETWRAELQRFGVPESDTAILGPPSDKTFDVEWERLSNAKWIIVSYALINQMMQQCFQWESPGMVIIDELHEVKARKGAKRADQVDALTKLTAYRLGISGTPFDNSPVDLFRILSIILGGNRFGTYGQFTARYCNGHVGDHGWYAGGATNQDELKLRLSYYMVRRTKAEVASELPPKTRQVSWIDAGVAAKNAFHRFQLGRVTMSDALLATLEDTIPAALEVAQEAGKYLLLTYTRAHAELMAEKLNVPFIHGGISTTKRAKIVKSAAERGTGLVATADSVGTGLDGLQHVASLGIMHSFDWRPLLMAQREDRLHRLGQVSNVHWVYPAAKGSIHEIVLPYLVKKLDAFRAVIGASEEVRGLRDSLSAGPAEDDEAKAMAEMIEEMKQRKEGFDG